MSKKTAEEIAEHFDELARRILELDGANIAHSRASAAGLARGWAEILRRDGVEGDRHEEA